MPLPFFINLAFSSDAADKALKAIQEITHPAVEALKETEKFTVAVIATMSAGKSTTLNAMFGVPLLPAKNEACTAVLTVIEDIDGMENVRARSIDREGIVSDWKEIVDGSDTISRWNCSDNRVIEIQGDFPHIDNHAKKIEFIDTPGPNNSIDSTHAEITHEIISKCKQSYVVFLMNATQFGVDDERSLLERIFEDLKNNNQQSKIVFAVNKIDELDFEKGETPIKLVETIKKYLGSIGYVAPNIIPIMSKTSLEIRQCLDAHRKGMELPFSARAQRNVLSEINLVLEHFDVYLDALLNCANKDEYLKRAFEQSRHIKSNDSVRIAGADVPVEKLIEADLLTGIPFLEEMLELELMAEKSEEPINVGALNSYIIKYAAFGIAGFGLSSAGVALGAISKFTK